VKARRVLAALLRALLVAIGLLSLAAEPVARLPVLGALGRAALAWFDFQCHRDPERSPWLLGAPLPVCARCLGIYVGLGLGALLLRPRLSVWPLRIWVGAAVLVMLLDVATEGLAMRPPFELLRLATGLLLAWPVGAAVVLALRPSG
jgi:uncharacterized membrane protein